MMHTLGIIPARAGSKRLPRKNVLYLGGKPLVCRVIEAALMASSIHRLVVSSDDEEVLRLAGQYNSALPLRRPGEYATDTSPAIEYVRHALAVCEAGGNVYDIVVIMQPSSPLTVAEDIDNTVAILDRTQADSAVSVVELDHAIQPVKLKIMDGDRLLPYLEEEGGRMAAHELPRLFVRNCAVYATRRRIVDDGRLLGADCRGYVMPRERSIDINDRLDYEFARFLMGRDANGCTE